MTSLAGAVVSGLYWATSSSTVGFFFFMAFSWGSNAAKRLAGSGGDGLGFLLAGLGVSLLLLEYPGIGQVEQIGYAQHVVLAVAVGVLPLFAVLVAASAGDRVAGAVFALVLPDGDLEQAVRDFVDGLVALGLLVPLGIFR